MKLGKKKFRKILIAVILVTLIITYGLPWAATLYFGNTEVTLSIAFEGAGQGLDPQGNRFDINEIKSDEILSAAIEDCGMTDKLTADELKKEIYILPVAGKDTLKQLLTLTTINGKTQDIKENIVYPTSFLIGLKDMGLPSYFADRKLMKSILQEYSKHLEAKYLADTGGEPAYSKGEILKMDYPEMMKVINQSADSLLRYIGSYSANEPQFVSQKSGLSFGDVYEQALLLQNTDITNMRSLVNYYRLTEDTAGRILYEQTMLKRAVVVANKLQGAEYTAADILQIYDNNSNYIFASQDAGSMNVTPVENQFYSDLMDALVEKQTSYINAKYNQQDIINAINKLQTGTLTGDAYFQISDKIKADAGKTLDRIEELRKLTMTMAKEFYGEQVAGKISISGTSYHLHSMGNPLTNFIILAGLTALVMALYFEIKRSDYAAYLESAESLFIRRKRKARQYKHDPK